MAKKFGKREKLVIGFLSLIGAIAAVHILVFQRPAQSLAEAKSQYEEALVKAESLPFIPNLNRKAIEDYERRTVSDERTLWNVLLNMNLVPSPNRLVFVKLPDFVPKLDPTADEKKKAEVKTLQKVQIIQNRAYQSAAENILTQRLERLIAMKKAYEAGAPWPGDLLTTPCQGVIKPVPMKLSFTDNKDDGWRLPIELKKELRESRPKLWDEVRHLHDVWSVMTQVSQTNQQYPERYQAFLTQLEQVGMPEVHQIHTLRTKVGKEIAAFNNVMMARLILQQVPEGPVPTVGLGTPLDQKLLHKMFIVDIPGLSTKMPRYYMLQTFNHQLIMLENLLPLARKNGVEDVSSIGLPASATMVERVLKKIDPNDPTSGGMPGGGFGMYGPMGGMRGPGGPGAYGPGGGRSPYGPGGPMGARGGYPGGPGGPMGRMFNPLLSLKGEERLEIVNQGQAALVVMSFTAGNQNAVNFLYDVVNDPRYFRIERLLITSVPKEEKVKVQVTIESLMEVKEVSSLEAGLVNPLTGVPKALTSTGKNPALEFWTSIVATAQKKGLDESKIISDSFQKAGYTPKIPFLLDPKMVVTDEKDPTLEEPPPTPEPTPTPMAFAPQPTEPAPTPAGGKGPAPLPDVGG